MVNKNYSGLPENQQETGRSSVRRVPPQGRRNRCIRSVPEKRRRGADPTDRFGIRPESGRRTGCDRGIYRRNQKNIAARGAYIIEGIGTLKIDSNSIYYLDSDKKAAQAILRPSGCRRTRILASGSSTATAPGAYDRPSGRKPQPAVPRSRRQSNGRLPRCNLNPASCPDGPVPQPTQQTSRTTTDAAASGQSGSADAAGAASSQPRSATALSTADAERRQPASDEPEAATAWLSAQAAAARTAGSKEIESGRFYRHRDHHRHHRARRDDLRFSGKSRRPRHPVDHPACTDRYRDRIKRLPGQRLVSTKTPAPALLSGQSGTGYLLKRKWS